MYWVYPYFYSSTKLSFFLMLKVLSFIISFLFEELSLRRSASNRFFSFSSCENFFFLSTLFKTDSYLRYRIHNFHFFWAGFLLSPGEE